MKMNVFVCILLYLVGSATIETRGSMTLELVQVLFRHGARTPTEGEFNTYHYMPADVYDPYGLGQLTNFGKELEYSLGQLLRKKYNDFLGDIYNSSDVYAISTDIERTKISLELVLAGLYPPTPSTTWNPNLKWLPIAYRYTPKPLDILLRTYDSSKYTELKLEAMKTEDFQKTRSRFTEFSDFIANKTGIDDMKKNVDKLRKFCDYMFSNVYMNLPLPDWYTSKTSAECIEYAKLDLDLRSWTPEMHRINAGPLIEMFIKNMNLNGSMENPRKIYLYSAHDWNVSSFTRALGIKQFRYPYFGSGIMFEKLRDSNDDIYVRLLGYDGRGNLMVLNFPGCEEYCPIEDYLKTAENVIPSYEESHYLLEDLNKSDTFESIFLDDPVVKQRELKK